MAGLGPLCHLQNLQVKWPGADRWSLSSLVIDSSMVYWLQGGNGVGKSTWLKVLAGLLPCLGEISWELDACKVINKTPGFYRTIIGAYSPNDVVSRLVCQEYYLRTGRWLSSSLLLQMEKYFSLPLTGECYWGEVSAGQQHTVQLCSLWYSEHAIWLLDEPFVYLDSGMTQLILSLIRSHISRGGAVILASHTGFDLPCLPLLLSRGVHV